LGKETAVAKKSSSKKATKKAASKPAKKAPAKKPVSRTGSKPSKKAPVKKTAAKSAKSAPAKKAPATKKKAAAKLSSKATKPVAAARAAKTPEASAAPKAATPVASESAAKTAPAASPKAAPTVDKNTVTGTELLDKVGFGKKIVQRTPIVELSRGKEPIELHHRQPTKRELAELRSKLEKRLADLTSDVEQLAAEVQDAEESSTSSTDVVDSSSAQYEHDFMLQRIESESEELTAVRRALAKMDGKVPGQEYGQCEATGIWISIERLNAKPEARLCVAAVEKFEREGGGEEFGVPMVRK